MKIALFCVLFAYLVWIWGRRDEMHEKFSAIADRFKKKREENASASTDSDSPATQSAINKLLKRTGIGEKLGLEVVAEMFANWLSKLMRVF